MLRLSFRVPECTTVTLSSACQKCMLRDAFTIAMVLFGLIKPKTLSVKVSQNIYFKVDTFHRGHKQFLTGRGFPKVNVRLANAHKFLTSKHDISVNCKQ